DRVIHDDAGGRLSQGSRLPRLPVPLRHVSRGDQDEPLATKVERAGRQLDRELGTVGTGSETRYRLGLAAASTGEDRPGGWPRPFRDELETVKSQQLVERVSELLTSSRVRVDDAMISVQDGNAIYGGVDQRGQIVETEAPRLHA